jgi:hypothetical protein
MCRLAFITRRFAGIPDWLEQMEKSFGGDGNGIATLANGIRKGVNLSVKGTVDILEQERGPALWHSRKVSSGMKCDELCHPFPTAGGFLVHNGHWSEGARMAEVLDTIYEGDYSDTWLMARLIRVLGFRKAVNRYKPSGVWLYMSKKGNLGIYKNGGNLWHSGKLRAFGSEAPANTEKWHHWHRVADGLYMPGDRIQKAPEPMLVRPRSDDCYSLFPWAKEQTAQLGFSVPAGGYPPKTQTIVQDMESGRKVLRAILGD